MSDKVEIRRKVGNLTATVVLKRTVTCFEDRVVVDDVRLHVEAKKGNRKTTRELLREASRVFAEASAEAESLAEVPLAPEHENALGGN